MLLTGNSNAKLNLFLHIVGKNKHGFHLIESIFAKLNLADQIFIRPNKDLICHVKNNNIKIKEENIVITAAKTMQRHFCINSGAEITIVKNIPIASGLGGGSSNAATVLHLLAKLWKIPINEYIFKKIGLGIGSDVPFFLQNEHAFVRGIGEQISHIQLNEILHVLLINPHIPISTAEVYKKNVKSFTPKITNPPEGLKHLLIYGHNDLQNSILTLVPKLSEILNILQIQDGCIAAKISGSGATCFGIFSTLRQAEIAKQKIQLIHKNWWYNIDTIYI